MCEELKADEQSITEWNSIADVAIRELRLAGLTATRIPNKDAIPGAQVMVDQMGDGGGVFVTWRPAPPPGGDFMESIKRGDMHLRMREIRHRQVIAAEMNRAILAILNSAGFIATDASDDIDPYTIRVERGEKNM
ncbi:hypothetical protein [Streptomyces sp. SGAir0957]